MDLSTPWRLGADAGPDQGMTDDERSHASSRAPAAPTRPVRPRRAFLRRPALSPRPSGQWFIACPVVERTGCAYVRARSSLLMRHLMQAATLVDFAWDVFTFERVRTDATEFAGTRFVARGAGLRQPGRGRCCARVTPFRPAIAYAASLAGSVSAKRGVSFLSARSATAVAWNELAGGCGHGPRCRPGCLCPVPFQSRRPTRRELLWAPATRRRDS